jgi:hypothetical protein
MGRKQHRHQQEDWKKPNGKGQKAKAGIKRTLTLKAPTGKLGVVGKRLIK